MTPRLIDLIHEDLDQYQDAQVGAAARPCLKQCRQSLDRMLKIEKLFDAAENDSVPVDGSASPAQVRWVGETASQSGEAKLVHAGWKATVTELPQWSGKAEDAEVIAPAPGLVAFSPDKKGQSPGGWIHDRGTKSYPITTELYQQTLCSSVSLWLISRHPYHDLRCPEDYDPMFNLWHRSLKNT